MRIDASHEFGTETWEQRARACAADLEAAKRGVACWKEVAKNWRKKAIINRMAMYDVQAMLNVEHLRSERAEAEIERLKAADAELRERLRLCEKTNKYFAKQMNWGTP